MGTYLLNRQILRRELAEKELLHHERLQGVVEMAGAVCHEMNQPLMAISGYSELLLMDLDEKDQLGEKLTKIKEQVDRLGRITLKLMNITKYETKDYIESKIIDIDKASIEAT
jgi:signal transduction histidine kinase